MTMTIGIREKPKELSDRELEVVRLIAKGYSSVEVGRLLFITDRTVQQHVRNVFNKLGVDSRIEMIIELLWKGKLKIEEVRGELE